MEGQGGITHSPPHLLKYRLLLVSVIVKHRQGEKQRAEIFRLSSMGEKHTKVTIHEDYKTFSLDMNNQLYGVTKETRIVPRRRAVAERRE